MNKCPICHKKVTQKYFAFPKLPKSSEFSNIFGLTHLDCLYAHPRRHEIQEELVRIYMTIFNQENSTTPIVSRNDFFLVKFLPDREMLEVYDFEDFASFYVSINQTGDLINLKPGDEIDLGNRGWITLTSSETGKLTLIHHSIKGVPNIVNLSRLDLCRLKNLVSEALKRVSAFR